MFVIACNRAAKLSCLSSAGSVSSILVAIFSAPAGNTPAPLVDKGLLADFRVTDDCLPLVITVTWVKHAIAGTAQSAICRGTDQKNTEGTGALSMCYCFSGHLGHAPSILFD